jgi:hypothetical protein
MQTKSLALLLAGACALVSCNCGHGAAVGGSCSATKDCAAGLVCLSGTCALPDGGRGGPPVDSGSPGAVDSGPSCVNLQCNQVSCADGGTTTVTGTVYDPAGNVALYDALVYVPNGPVLGFDAGVSCDVCGAFATGEPLVTALTGPDGTFSLTNVPAGASIPMVIQIGRWRRVVTLPNVAACAVNPVTDVNLLRLPRNQSEGDIPQIAIATGSADPFECLLRKIGIDDAEFTAPDGGGRVHYYVQNGTDLLNPAPPASDLWADGGPLLNYDVVLLPCEGGENPKPPYATQNIIDYTSAGGRMFTTHYGYVWTAFAQAPFPSTGNWQPDKNQMLNPPDPYDVTIDESFPKGMAFGQWLSNVGASTTAGQLTLHQARRNIWGVNPPTRSWMLGELDGGVPQAIPHLTFNTPVNPPPAADGGPGLQCGRVVFSDFHVNTDVLTDAGYFPASCSSGTLTAQEKALIFMLFDLSACVQSDQTAPMVCHGFGQDCSPAQGCCNGYVCLDAQQNLCSQSAVGGCACAPQIP